MTIELLHDPVTAHVGAGPPLKAIRLTESANAVAKPINVFAAPGPIEVNAAIGRPEDRQKPSAMCTALCS
jgi:hypothetical protein